VRTALGAGRGRILRQLLTESAVLAAGGGALGLVFAWLGVDALLAIDPTAVPRSDAVSLDATVVLFTIGVSAFTALLFGVVPAIRVSHGSVGAKLHEGGRGGRRGVSSNRMQGLLVAAQMAMAVILLTGSGLMMRTFVSLLSVDPGFSAEDVLTLRVSAPSGAYPDATAVVGFYDELLRRVRELPGVESAGAARILPLASTMGDSGFRPVGYVPQPNESLQADWQYATPGYLETMGVPLIEGRTIEMGDNSDGQNVMVINQTLANRYWPDRSPLGVEVMSSNGDTAIVVGVVGNVAHNGITGEVNERYYKPQAQVAGAGNIRGMTLTIGTRGDPRAFIGPVRGAIQSLDATLPVSNIQTFDEVLSSSVAQPRFAMMLLSAFGSLAIILAIVGIYGVLAYSVNQRTQEIGVRMALGAETGQVIRLVVRQGMIMALAGVAVGTGIAWFATDLMSGMLYGVEAQDLATFISVPALFAAVALLACWIPAGRAARVRPSNALRYE
jgi:putative ABC transport system permease protein